MTELCAIRGCSKRSVHLARVTSHDGNPYAGPLLKEEVLEALGEGQTVPLCPEHYVWVVSHASSLSAA